MAEQLNLMQRLAKVRDIADVAVKDKKGFNYSYADISQILAKVKAGMKRYGITLIPMITPGTSTVVQTVSVNTKLDKSGKPYDQTVTEMLFKADMVFRWLVDENPTECLDVPWTVTGSQTDPSQAFGSSMTYCTRYFLTNYFQIPQVASTDVDEYRGKQKAAAEAEDMAIAKEIIEKFDVALKKYLADNPDSTEDVKKFLTRYAKNANYFAIKEPSLAAKLFDDFRNTYLKGE